MHKILLIFLLTLGVACAQSDRGTITGVVNDPTSAPVPNAAVTATHSQTGLKYSAQTSDSGNFVIPQLPVGRYEINAEAPGFRRFVHREVQVSVAQTVTLNMNLQLGPVEQVIEVESAPPVIESSTSDLGTVISSRSVVDLPLAVSGNQRNPESFIFLTPGVTGDLTNTQVNGSPSRAKEILLDGISSSSPESGGLLFTSPSVEAIGEFKMLSSNYTAEYGRTGGGFEIFTTKSGTNEYHGALFNYLRNDVFDARGFYAPRTPVNRQNEFGVSIGGPVRIPSLYDGRNKTFFNVVYSGFRFRAGALNEVLTIPAADFRRGDFSRLVDRTGNQIPIYDPGTTQFNGTSYTRQQFPGNVIPADRFSEVSRRILEILPQPTNNGIANNFIAVGNQTFDRDQINVKLDHSFSDRSRLSGFVYIGEQKALEAERLPSPLSGSLDEDRLSRWARLTHDFVVSATSLNHLAIGFTREVQQWRKLSSGEDWPTRLGLQGVNTGAGNTFPTVTFSDGYTTWGDNAAFNSASAVKSTGLQANNAWQVTDTFSWLRGKHSFKAGGEGRYLQTNGADFLNSQGRFDFRALETGLPGTAASGNAFASFLLGAVDIARYQLLAVVPSNEYRYAAMFFQDDWKVSSRLTLNLGLRYEIFFPRTERFGNMSGFDPDLPNPAAGGRPGAVAFLGEGPGRIGRSSFADTDFKAFGPRLGFAYLLTDKTVLRGGYGISYAPGNANAGLRSSQRFGYGFNGVINTSSTDAGITPALNWDNGIRANFTQLPRIEASVANGQEVDYIGREDGRAPYFQNFTFTVQREMPWNILTEASYVGVKGTRLGTGLMNFNELDPAYLSLGQLLTRPVTSPEAQAANIPIPYPGFTGTVAQALRPYPQFLNIPSRSNPNGNSTYHALQTKVEKRFSQGLSFLASYTWSKTLSDADMLAGLGPSGQTYYNRRLEKSLSTNDVPHNFALSYIYDLPFGPGRRFLNRGGALGRITGGWTITGIHQYYSGRPIVLTANNGLPLSNAILRPNVRPEVPRTLEYEVFEPAVDRLINPAAFEPPAPFTFGTAARSYSDVRSAPWLNESFGLIKRTSITERVLLTFRAEFFNAFNRVVFGPAEGNVNNTNFGRVNRQANAPRQGQLALRLEF